MNSCICHCHIVICHRSKIPSYRRVPWWAACHIGLLLRTLALLTDLSCLSISILVCLIFGPETDLISLPSLLLFLFFFFLLFLLGDLFKSPRLRRFKSDQNEIWQDCSSSISIRIAFRISDMMSYFQDGDHDVISHRKWCNLVSAQCTRSVCPAHMQQRPPVPDP